MADARKRGRHDGSSPFVNGGFKKQRPEMDSTGGGKSKPCTKFFSTSGCPFGENCHFLHHVPGGYNAVTQMMNLQPVSRGGPPAVQNDPGHGGKSRLCSKFNTPEGCKFGDKCHYAHGEWELNKSVAPSYGDPRSMPQHIQAHYGARPELPAAGLATGFGASATAKISVDASLAGAIIGKGGVNSKQISRQTGAKLCIRDHESDPKLKNIELEGTFDQIKTASAMVRDLVANLSSGAPMKQQTSGGQGGHGARQHSSNNFKTKLCERYANGTCTYGDKCNFAHGASQLRKSGV